MRYWTLPADPEAGHPEPFPNTWAIVDEVAGGIVAYVSTRERAEEWLNLLQAGGI